MIPYIEIIGKHSLQPFAVIEPSQCWFELSYYEMGEFEIYCPASINALNALKNGNYVKIPNKPYLWVIKSVQYTFNAEGARMVDAKGFEAKWIVGQRVIRDPLQLPSNLHDAMHWLFNRNLGVSAIEERRIAGLSWDFSVCMPKTTEAQATRGNLLEFVQSLLKLHRIGLISTLENGGIKIRAVSGSDRSESVVFSQSMDNLISATYFESDADLKTNCQIVSSFNEQEEDQSTHARTNVTHDYVAFYPPESQGGSGIDRMEMLLESNLSTKVKQEDGTEIEIDPSSATYQAMQQAEGANALAEKMSVVDFSGDIDLQYSNYEFETDFFIGDFVKVMDEYFGYSAKARIVKYTFKQDESGYGEEAEYGE